MKKKYIVLTFITINIVLFILCANFWYKETNELYKRDNLKREIIKDIEENPDEFKKYYNIEKVEDLTPEVFDNIYSKSQIGRYIFIASASIPISLIGSIILFIPIRLILSIIRKSKKYQLSIDDFKKNNGYYRDLLKDYNPLELSYNNNYDLDDNSLIAMLLYLEKKKVINLKDNKISINDNIDNLNEFEKKFINSIDIDKNKISVSKSNIISLVDNSCKNKKLLTIGNIPKKRFIIDLITSIFCYILLFIIWKNINSILNAVPSIENTFFQFSLIGIMILILLLVIFYPFIIFTKYFILYAIINQKHSKRTDLGNEINYKLEGLKNFIRDFSTLDERSKEEIIIWDDYLIYSVLFGDNTKIYNEMKDRIKYSI